MESIHLKRLIQSLCPDTGKVKCSVRLLDTVFIDTENKVVNWYFTTKSGYISKKKSLDGSTSNLLNDEVSANIVDRFSRFSLANPNNKDKIVGIFVHGNGYRQQLNANGLLDLLKNNSIALTQSGRNIYIQ